MKEGFLKKKEDENYVKCCLALIPFYPQVREEVREGEHKKKKNS